MRTSSFFNGVLPFALGKALSDISACFQHFTIRSPSEARFCQKYHVKAGPRPTHLHAECSQAAFGAVPPNGIPQLLPRNKSDTTGMAVSLMIALLVVLRAYNNRKVWRMKTVPRREELGDFSAGFNSLHLKIS